MDINFELYKVFYHVARHLNFSEAAQQLFISQSAVSQSIKLLEEKLNCRLFLRHTKQVRLTQEGEALFRHIEQAYHFIKSGEKHIHQIHSLQEGEVRIGASDTICKYYLLPFIREFYRQHPKIRIHITNRTSPVCIELLKKGIVDLAVANLPEESLEPSLHVHQLAKVQYAFVAGDAFIDLKGREISIKELEGYPILTLEKNTTTRSLLDAFLLQHDAAITPEIEISSVDLLLEFAKIGLGISFVMEDSLKDMLSMDELFRLNIRETLPQRNLGVLSPANLPVPIAASRFLELLMK